MRQIEHTSGLETSLKPGNLRCRTCAFVNYSFKLGLVVNCLMFKKYALKLNLKAFWPCISHFIAAFGHSVINND